MKKQLQQIRLPLCVLLAVLLRGGYSQPADVATTSTPTIQTTATATASTDPLTSPAMAQQIANDQTVTSSALHQQPGHACPNCGPNENLPPWRRRLMNRTSQEKPKEEF
jgi:hypothetical protein